MIVKNLFLITILIGGTFRVRAQLDYVSYYQLINNAERFFYIDKKFQQADSCFQLAFKLAGTKGFNVDFLNAAINAQKINDTVLLNHYLLGFAQRGGDFRMLKNKFAGNKILEENARPLWIYLKRPKNKNLRFQLEKLHKKYVASLNKKLLRKIRKILFLDQLIARGLYVKNLQKMGKTDEKNVTEIVELCQKCNCWIGSYPLAGERNKYGKYNYSNGLNLVIHHFTKEELIPIVPYIENAIKSLDYYPHFLASTLDYANINSPRFNEKENTYEVEQIYGTYHYINNNEKTVVPFGKTSIEELNQKRVGLYLEPIGEYWIKRGGAKMPTEEFAIVKKKQ